MASTGLDFVNQFTLNNEGITDLRKLLFLERIIGGSVTQTCDFMNGVRQGERIGGVGELDPVGLPSNGCSPQWKNTNLVTQEKQWDLGAYEVAEQICYDDFKDTIVRYAMNKGTDIADLTTTDYFDAILDPVMREALDKMIWRLVWFGDKDADNVDDGGVITDGVNPALFRINDGLFKRLYAIIAANSLQRVTIAANTATTYEDQISAIRAAGIATGIFDKILFNAPIKLRQRADKVLLVTQSLADALTIDVKRNNGSDLQWTAVLDGLGNEVSLMTTTKYNGQTIIALPIWDEMIQSFEDDGTKWNNPHRAVFASKTTLKAGTESFDMIADLQIFFVQKDQMNHMLVKDKVGTLVWEDNLTMFAY